MLKRLVFTIVFVGFYLSGSLLAADSRLLVVSLQLPPKGVVDKTLSLGIAQQGAEKINTWGTTNPEKFAKRMIKGLVASDILPASTSGIVGIYGGYFAYSDQMGNLTFPLRHTEPQVDVIFTPSIDLERLYQETYSGIFISQASLNATGIANAMMPTRFLYSLKMGSTADAAAATPAAPAPDAKAPAKAAVVERPADTWTVTKSSVAMDTRLPTNAVVILVNPRNIFVPTESFPTSGTPHYVLPDSYVIGKNFNDAVLLNNQKNLRYFEEISVVDGSAANKGVTIQQSAVMND
jgi:hypothetical protein